MPLQLPSQDGFEINDRRSFAKAKVNRIRLTGVSINQKPAL